jgi:hypothetical protein
LIAYGNERIDALFESLQLLFKCCIDVIGHSGNIEPGRSRINQ